MFSVTAGVAQKPNVVLILTDDQGYQDAGCFGSPRIQTPNLDRMAQEGTRFTSFYAAAPICSPSRAGLLTGRYPERIGIKGVYFPHSDTGLPLEEITLAQLLKPQGYATACIGKWHLGHLPPYLPTRRGFDCYFGVPYSNDMWLDPENIPPADGIVFTQGKTLQDYLKAKRDTKAGSANLVPLMRGEACVEWPADQATLTRRYAEESIAFIKENKNRPFFLYVTPAMPHVPLFASEAFKGKSAGGLYGDTIEEIDWAVGEILRTLQEEGLAEKTLVIFSSDNGPWLIKGDHGGSAAPLREGKNSSYEGGARVPGIAWWPGTVPAGRTCDEVVSALDMMPTVAAMAGASVPADRIIDGHNILPLLRGEPGATSPWEVIYFETSALRAGKWKYRNGPLHARYIKNDNPTVTQLFDLEADIGEQNNLIESYPEKAEEYRQMLNAFRQIIKESAE